MDQYLPILILAFLGFAFTVFSLVSSAMLAPKKKPTAAKLAPYESGIVPNVEPPQRFPVRFYLVSMIFIIFDIEIVFLYPWAVVFHQIATFGLIEVIVFAAVVFRAGDLAFAGFGATACVFAFFAGALAVRALFLGAPAGGVESGAVTRAS